MNSFKTFYSSSNPNYKYNLLSQTFKKGVKHFFSPLKSSNNERYFSKSYARAKIEGTYKDKQNFRYRTIRNYALTIGVFSVGMSYAAVPLYRLFCQAYSYGGTTRVHDDAVTGSIDSLIPVEDREITISFTADTSAQMTWNFKPEQKELKVIPGETALAFFSARNPTDKTVLGISTYNVLPYEAGQYFNKIQCFCFEEQILNPKEEVSLPVFFYIDPEFADDPSMEYVEDIMLSYTFFAVKEGLKLPFPQFSSG